MHSHIRSETAAVKNVACLPEWTVRTTDVMVISPKYNRSRNRTVCNGLVKGTGNSDPSFRICIEDTRLGPDYQTILLRF